MSWLRKSGVLVLLVLMGLATNHCRLESLPGLEFLSCCQHQDAEKAPAHHEKDCATDGCEAVESGLYKMVDDATLAPILPVLLASTGWERLVAPLEDSTPHFVPASPAPPELPRFWQFHYRTALPPRAPSFVA
jgi:hypothetical protein